MIQFISISFQLSGAVILLLWCLKGANKEQVIQKYFPGSSIVTRDDEDNCILVKEKLQAIASEVYINALAFIDLIVGYLVSYFTASTYPPIVAVILTILTTVAIIFFERLIAKILAKRKYSVDLVIPYSYLEKYDVSTFTTDKEVKEMIDDIFGDI